MLELLPVVVGVVALAFVQFLYYSVTREGAGTDRMREIAGFVEEGAKAYMRRQYTTISYFVLALAAVIALFRGAAPTASFLLGAALSLAAAYVGMTAATKANVRTAAAAVRSPGRALKVAFWGGAVMGVSIVGLSVLGIGGLYSTYLALFGSSESVRGLVLDSIVPFGLGASLASLFAQLGGGIYTKAADVGADLVGKVEAGIPEDDPRNPAVIADQVGNNVVDCAGRGADLFKSFSDNIIGMMILGLALHSRYGEPGILFPLLAESVGVLSTIAAVLLIRETGGDPVKNINTSLLAAGVLNAAAFYLLGVRYLGDPMIFASALLGLAASLLVGLIVQYYTGLGYRPVREIASSALYGPAIDVISGLAVGLESAFLPLVVISAVVAAAYLLAGLYGIAAATAGILSTTGIIMAADAFGPISDNAAGIAEMGGLGPEVREGLDLLDAVGNTTKAITKGYAMACAVMSAFVLFAAYLESVGLADPSSPRVDVADPYSMVGVILGGTLAFLFSAMAIRAVGKTAGEMVAEVRRQFREIPGLLEGRAKPDYARAVDIATRHALREMVVPTLLALASPVAVGLALGVRPLGAFIVGATVVGGLLAIFMINAGGALDNAKKLIESGLHGGKGSDAHKAAVVGDTVGDPLKDTAGPSLHIFVKLVTIVALTFAPLFL